MSDNYLNNPDSKWSVLYSDGLFHFFPYHLAASYAYCGDLAFTGCPYENLVNAGVIAYINHLFGMEEPPKGELSFSNANVTAVREGDIQKTPDITLNGDHRNKITIPVPQGVT